jgi:hypothetical protein
MEEDSMKRTGSEAKAPRTGAARFSARRPTPLSNALLLVVTVLAVFCAAELVLRAVYHPENLHSVVRFDDVLGWSLRPRADFRSADNEDGLCYRIQTNSLGMREREFDRVKKPGRKRILVIGDSIAFGTGVDAKWRFSDFLARAFGDDVEVLNAGVCGWGSDQELLYYETKGRALRPDIVILTFTMANDVLNNMLGHLFLASAPKPRFVLDGEDLVLEKRTLDPPRPSLERRVKNVLRNSRVLVFVKRRVDTVRYETRVRHEAAGVHAGFDREGLEKNCSHWSVYEASYGPEFEEAWRVTEAILSRFARDCKEDGTEFLVFVFPLQLVVDEHWRNGLIRDFSIDAAGFDFERPYQRLSAFCGGHGIDYFYPVDAFREASKGRSLYFERDSHPNKWGHAAAAGALLENLHERIGLEYRVAGADRDLMYPRPVAPAETGGRNQAHN